ncbi:glycosyltransferase [Telluribacter sp. SYSU D00476]|uniref:glycosyltransferase n=1 Tax=Telluribacter sp. SYSU D00476 TaxID=2811430 RepID=UPI001FF6F343|nr:glycosyltransferase [Telluribacter sp. SYSU D00476]
MAAYDIVCVAFPSWEGNYVKSTVKLMEELAQRHRILYIDYQYTWKDALMGLFKTTSVPVSRMLGLTSRLREVQVGDATVHVLTPPPVLPVNFLKSTKLYDAIQRLNAGIVLRSIRKAYSTLHIEAPVVINAFNPSLGVPLAGKLSEKSLIYYCYDEISACAWAKDHGARSEVQYSELVDAIIVSSDGLFRSKQRYGKPAFVVNNGVDFNEFQKGYIPIADKPAASVIGYVGSIDSRLDYDLLIKLAQKLLGQKLIMVGRIVYDKPHVEEAVKVLSAMPNVHFTGAKAPHELPYLLAQFNVGLIPFVKNEQTEAIYPMKINEYLAAGLPVVSTDFAPLAAFQEVVAVTTTQEGFITAVQEALQDKSEKEEQRRVALARQHSWQERAHELEAIIEKVIHTPGRHSSPALGSAAQA